MDKDKKLVEAFFDNYGCADKLVDAFCKGEKDVAVNFNIESHTVNKDVKVYSCVADGTNVIDGKKNIVFIKNLIAIVDRMGSFIEMPKGSRIILDKPGHGIRIMIAVGSGNVGIESPEDRLEELLGYVFGGRKSA